MVVFLKVINKAQSNCFLDSGRKIQTRPGQHYNTQKDFISNSGFKFQDVMT